MPEPLRPIEPGAKAPDFTLPAANREGDVSLAQFRGKRAVMIAFFRGLHCPFCRRQAEQLGRVAPELAKAGVETLAIFNTVPDRARLYLRYHPNAATVLADADCVTHRAFGIPAIGIIEPGSSEPSHWPRLRKADFEAARIDPTGEIGEKVHPIKANEVVNAKDGFELTEHDKAIFAKHATQLSGHFLIDRAGVVRWMRCEASRPPEELCRFPTPSEMIEAARALPGA
jgi:peroxiredoxin